MDEEKKKALRLAVDALWSMHPYKVILSNAGKSSNAGERQYRKIVMNRLKDNWQAEKYTEQQVFHENLEEDQGADFLAEALTGGFRQCNAWDERW